MQPVDRAVLDKFKSLIARRYALHKMILFGSRARGDADPDSDVDVVVVLEGAADSAAREFVSDCAWEAAFHHGLVLVPLVFGLEEWNSGPERNSLLVQAVEKDGVLV